MALTKIKNKKFKTKAEASKWAKAEKKRAGKGFKVSWETNRTQDSTMKWEAVLYKDMK